MKRFAKIVAFLFGFLLVLMALAYVVLQQPTVQTWLGQKVAANLSNQWNTKVQVDRLNFTFLEDIVLEDVYIEDHQSDTLLHTGRLRVQLDALDLFDKKISVEEIGLSKGELHVARQADQKQFNYHFLTRFFQGGKDNSQKPEQPWQIDLNHLNLDQVGFHLNDQREGNKIDATVRDLALDVQQLNVVEKRAAVQSVTLEGVFFHYRRLHDTTKYLAKEVDSQRVVVSDKKNYNDQSGFLPGWQITTNDLRVVNSAFRFDDQMDPSLQDSVIDYNHLHATKINIAMENLSYADDTLSTNITDLSLLEKSGFAINELSSDFTISDQGFNCRDLTLRTNNSQIQHYFAMDYSSFADFKDFNNRVEMHGKFKNSQVALRDIQYFAHELDKIEHNRVTISGNVQGEVSHLNGDDINMQLGRNSEFNGDFSLRGLPDVEETFITFRLDRLATNAADIERVYPDIDLPAEVKRMGWMVFDGAFDGFYNDFVAEGTLTSSLGELQSDLNLKIDEATGVARYKGRLAGAEFDLGRMFDKKDMIGQVTFESVLQGEGLQLSKLNADLDTDIQRLELNGYQYNDIVMEGHVKQRLFSGLLEVDDDHLGLDFQGTVNFNKEKPDFQANATIDTANLKAIGFTDDAYILQSNMKLDFKGNSIDNLLGNIGLYNTRIDKNDKTYKLDSFQLDAQQKQDEKSISLSSGLADARFKGALNFQQLVPVLSDYLNNYFNTRLRDKKVPEELFSEQFQYHIHLKETKSFTNMFFPDWRLPGETILEGSFDSKDYDLLLNASIPALTYGNTTFHDIHVKGESDKSELTVSSNIAQVQYNDSLISEDISLTTTASNDSVHFSTNLKGASDKNHANINGLFSTEHDSFIVAKLLPSEVFLNNKKWQISENNYVRYSPGRLTISQFQMRQGDHKLNVESYVNTNDNTVVALGLKNIRLGDVTHPFFDNPDYHIHGIANGNIRITDIFNDPFFISTLNVEDVSFNADTIGDVELISNYEREEQTFHMDMNVSGNEHNLRALGTYKIGDKDDTADIDIDIDKINLATIEKYVDQEVSNIAGWAEGNLHLAGNFQKPELTGSLTFNDAEFTVNYLNTHYSLDNQQMSFEKRWVDFQRMTLQDKKGNTAKLGGQIFHQNLRDLSLDAYLSTDRFRFLNTTRKHNEDYYGTAYGDGTVVFQGPLDDIEMFISAKTGKKTELSIPIAGSNKLENNNFYRFVNINDQSDSTSKTEEFETNTQNFRLNFDLDVTPDALVRLIFDLESGDIIKARGQGNIEMLINNFGDFNMVGTYEIREGDYLFTFQDIVNKKFVIESGGKIIWTGNPYKARLDLNAIYETRTAPYPLIANLIREDEKQLETAKDRYPVDLYLQLGGSLLSPNIGFDIQMPEAPPTLRSPVESQLRAIKQNENELNRQVFGLLVLNNFLPDPNRTRSLAAQTTSGVDNTVSEFLSNQVSMYFSDWFSQFVTEMDFDFSYRQYEVRSSQNQDNSSQDPEDVQREGQEVEVEMSKKFFNDRVSVNVGGNVDINNTSTSKNQNRVSNITSDFVVEYDIQEDGNVKVKAFRKGDYDMFTNERESKTGAGLFYSERFDTFGELIRKITGATKGDKKKSKRQEEENPQPTQQLP